MTESECLSKMVEPGRYRPTKFGGGVIQILITRTCNLSCFGCTQGSNLGGKPMIMTPDQFEIAVKSLKGFHGVTGIFGGNPATSPHFVEICSILRKHVPREQRGLWCNDPVNEENARAMRETFNPRVSNLNCHLVSGAMDRFKKWWPESMPFGVDRDSRHAPVFLAMRDVIPDEGARWDLISRCTINQHWSALVGVFRGQVRAWFCEVAGAQAMLHENEPDYPDTGVRLNEDGSYEYDGDVYVQRSPEPWYKLPMTAFKKQVRKHCHECAVPLNGYGELSQATDGTEQTSETHAGIYKPKKKDRKVEIVTDLVQLGTKRVGRVIDYLQNGSK
jgi:Radical SAM superfamily